MIDRFEAEWCERFGVRCAVGVSSGTAGLHLAMIAAGVSADDLVVTTPFSFVASANAVLYQHAIPIFVDIDPLTLNLAPVAVARALHDLEAGGEAAARWLPRRVLADRRARLRRAKALLPVHVFGQPASMTPLLSAAAQHDVIVIEDACEAPGAEYDGRPTGSFGAAAVFGFYPNKPMTTGEGGMVTTNEPRWADLLRSLRNQGRSTDTNAPGYVRLGYNYRLNELSAALGLGQLRRVDELLAKRARVAAAYGERLQRVEDIVAPYVAPTTTRTSWFCYVVRVAPHVDREAVIAALAAEGIESRAYFQPIHLQPIYRERFGYREGDFPVTESVSRSTIALPFHGNLSDAQIDRVVERLAHAVARYIRSPFSKSQSAIDESGIVKSMPAVASNPSAASAAQRASRVV
jgi:dTDP-4-amino-4,6-dideoxygalactose transaminase